MNEGTMNQETATEFADVRLCEIVGDQTVYFALIPADQDDYCNFQDYCVDVESIDWEKVPVWDIVNVEGEPVAGNFENWKICRSCVKGFIADNHGDVQIPLSQLGFGESGDSMK